MSEPTTGKPCPICGKPAQQKFRPFCTQRCKDVDLHRWLTGGYAIQETGNQEADEDGGATGAPERPSRP